MRARIAKASGAWLIWLSALVVFVGAYLASGLLVAPFVTRALGA